MDNKEFKLHTLYFYISGGCNLACKHCWINPAQTNRDLNFEGVKEVVNQAAELGVSSIKLTGGEPFLRTDIFQILHFIKNKDLHVIIETNGTFIQDKEAVELKRLGIDFISVSIDSPEAEFHDDFRGVKGVFELTIRGVKVLKKTGFSPQVIASIYRRNVADIERLALFAQDLGASSLKINPIMSMGRAKDFSQEELLSIRELIDLEKYIQEDLQLRIKMPILLDIPPAFKKLSYIKVRSLTCRLLGMIGILSDGTISLCGIGEEIEELNMGHISKDRLKYIWKNHELLYNIRENIPDKLEGICRRCVWKKFCLGKCRAQTYNESRSLTAPFSFCQKAYELGYFPQTRIYNQVKC